MPGAIDGSLFNDLGVVYMTFSKLLILVTCILFGVIGIAALLKGRKSFLSQKAQAPFEVAHEVAHVVAHVVAIDYPKQDVEAKTASGKKKKDLAESFATAPTAFVIDETHDKELPFADRIDELFRTTDPKLAIVQTLKYKSRVPWLKGRPAWISDYAAHYSTSRHFIARSLNKKADYFKQDISEGDRFNVLNPDKQFSFHLLVDTSRSKMWFYYLDLDTNEYILLKTYSVGLGRLDSSKASGMVTPHGTYTLGHKVAIYKPKVYGMYRGKKTEMIQIFGTRWIPFDSEVGECTAPAAGLGLHGVPWVLNEKGELVENTDSLGKYEGDGFIRLSSADLEEIFSIVITRKTAVELVKDFFLSHIHSSKH